MTGLGLLILSTLCYLVVAANRRWAAFGLMLGGLFLTQGQAVNVFGFNLFAIRILGFLAFLRAIYRGELKRKESPIDRHFVWLYIFTTVLFLLRSTEGYAYAIGSACDILFAYFAFRAFIKETEDFKWCLRALSLALIPYAGLVLWESIARVNLFTAMGGIEYGDWVRDGRPRCQGSFRHPSLLGTLGATFLPVFIGLYFERKHRTSALCGIMACLSIVWCSNSGGPVSTAAFGLVAWGIWRFRDQLHIVRLGLTVGIVGLALVMKAPVWYLLAKASSITGGDGWHRSYLIDVAFQNIGNWWLWGMPISGTANWFEYELVTTGGGDLTNQFLSFGINAGLGALILFILLLRATFKCVGRAARCLRQRSRRIEELALLWGLGAAVVAHIANWLGITYFDQTYVFWVMQMASIAGIAQQLEMRPDIVEACASNASTMTYCDEQKYVRVRVYG